MAEYELRDWGELEPEIRAASPDFHALFAYLYSEIDERPPIMVCEYAYGDWVVDNGTPLLPSANKSEEGDILEVPSEYRISGHFPFGVILRNSLEIEAVQPRSKGAVRPQAILGQGASIGLFELQDLLAYGAPQRLPDWRISAGSRLASPLQGVPVGLARPLRTQLGITLPPKQIDALTPLYLAFENWWLGLDSTRQRWVARVAYFPDRLFSRLTASDLNPEISRHRATIGTFAWSAAAPSQNMDSGLLYSQLHDAYNVGRSATRWKAAICGYDLAVELDEILDGRRACQAFYSAHEPNQADAYFASLGPFEAVSTGLRLCGRSGYLALPQHLSAETKVGFLRLPLLDSYPNFGSGEEVLHALLNSPDPDADRTIAALRDSFAGKIILRTGKTKPKFRYIPSVDGAAEVSDDTFFPADLVKWEQAATSKYMGSGVLRFQIDG